MYANSCRPALAGRFRVGSTAIARLGALAVLALLALSGLSGCISTSLVEHWRDTSFAGPPLHKVLVVGVQKDGGRRRIWEDGMVAALQRQGVQAMPSYRVFPEKAPTPDELESIAAREGFDGVLATHFIEASRQAYFGPYGPYYPYGAYGAYGPYGAYGAYGAFGFGWHRRYLGYWDYAYGPGYVDVEQRLDYQTDVFAVDPAGGKLIWSGITRSVDLTSASGVTDQISRVLVPDLGHEGILAGTGAGAGAGAKH
jgi:hypothetical protein